MPDGGAGNVFGAKGRVFQLKQYLARRQNDLAPSDAKS